MYHSHTKAIPLLKCLINYMYRYCLLGILVLCYKACSTSNFGMIVPFNLYCNDSECVHIKCIWQKLIIAQISITWIVKHYNFNSVQDSSNMNQTSRFRMSKCWQYHVLLIFQLCVMALWQLHGLIVWVLWMKPWLITTCLPWLLGICLLVSMATTCKLGRLCHILYMLLAKTLFQVCLIYTVPGNPGFAFRFLYLR